MIHLTQKIVKEVKKMMQKNSSYRQEDLNKSVDKVNTIINQIDSNTFKGKLFKYGNLKLQSNIARLALPEKITCSTACKGCYASKMLYDNTRISRLSNLLLMMHVLSNANFKKKFMQYVNAELHKHYNKCIKKKQKAIFRWHDSGDTFNLDYLKLMYDIATDNPQIQFYTYTKNINVFTYFELNKHPSNFNIVSSYIYNHVNYFDLFGNFDNEFIALENTFKQLRFNNEKAFMCNYNLDKFKERYKSKYNKVIKLLKEYKDVVTYSKEHLECGQCSACCSFTYTIFLKH